MAVDRNIVEEQLSAIGEADRWWQQPEMREVPGVLTDDERILAVTTGRLGSRLRRGRPWLILVTSNRIICLRGGERFGRRQLDVPVKQITALAHKTGLRKATITVSTHERKQRFRVSRSDALKLIGALSATSQRIAPVPGLFTTPVAFVERSDLARVYERIEMLEEEVERMRQQIDFTEELLRRRQGTDPEALTAGERAATPRLSAGSSSTP